MNGRRIVCVYIKAAMPLLQIRIEVKFNIAKIFYTWLKNKVPVMCAFFFQSITKKKKKAKKMKKNGRKCIFYQCSEEEGKKMKRRNKTNDVAEEATHTDTHKNKREIAGNFHSIK